MQNEQQPWPDLYFNPWMGCTKVSPGCDNCHINKFNALRKTDLLEFGAPPLKTEETSWERPYRWNRLAIKKDKRATAICGSLCDWADNNASQTLRDRMWVVLRDTPNIDWLLQTKHASDISRLLPADWREGYENVWLGVSVENRQHALARIDELRKIPAKVKFVSFEPLLEDVGQLNLAGIDWVIVGGEWTSAKRPMEKDWVENIRHQCEAKGIPFYFKQWASSKLNLKNNSIDGEEYQAWPNIKASSQPHAGRDPRQSSSRVNSKIKKLSDTEFRRLVASDSKMEAWRLLAAEWFAQQIRARENKRLALDKFLVQFIKRKKFTIDPYKYLMRQYHLSGGLTLPSFLESSVLANLSEDTRVQTCNYVHDFLQWILETKLTVEDDYGRQVVPPQYFNPVERRTRSATARQTQFETNKPALPYQYIRELRAMLCQGQYFKDWVLAHGGMDADRGLNSGDWFEVDEHQIDRHDPDCVWRRAPKWAKKGYEMWCPVRAIAIYVKLELPLRTFQMRMLDSGEADTWNYEKGQWVLNDSALARGSVRRPYQKGVFHKTRDLSSKTVMTGLYINTNKTADINKPENEKGYVIPWQNETVLYWLEKLRNWQKKYNPCESPVAWSTLTEKHFGRTPPHLSVLEEMGDICFLFRDPLENDAYGRARPIYPNSLNLMWINLLKELEKRCEARGETYKDGQPLTFTYASGSGFNPIYPMHSLRVSLITAYALEGGVPFPVLSKMIVGHSRLIMTLYYTKLGKAHITEIMAEAEIAMQKNEQEGYRRFLAEADYKQLESRVVYNDPAALHVVTQNSFGGASIVVEDRGVCPVGGCRCNEGGELVGGGNRTYAPVPGYPATRNCIRCRFFLTGPAFLPGLIAHFNSVSYNLTECSKKYVSFESHVRHLEDLRSQAERDNTLFTQNVEMHKANQLYEECAETANSLALDLNASMRLIQKCTDLLEVDTGKNNKLVALDKLSNIAFELKETTSEMHQLEVICENSVVFQGCDATKATLRRSQILDAMLQMNDQKPIFFQLNEEQQLLIGNEVMRLIRTRTGSMQGAVDIAEGRRRLSEIGLLDETMALIDSKTEGVAMGSLIDEKPRLWQLPSATAGGA